MANTRTIKIVPASETGVTVNSLLAAGFKNMPRNIRDGVISNFGDTDVEIALLEGGSVFNEAYVLLPVGESEVFSLINLENAYIRTTDAGGDNLVKIIGTPE